MEKHVNEFLNRIKNEFPDEINFSILGTTEKVFNSENQPLNLDTVIVNERMTFCIYSCDCGKCKNLVGIQIFYGHSSDLTEAKNAAVLIKKVVPKIQVNLIDEFAFFRKK